MTKIKSYWLMKSEPDEVSIDDLEKLGGVPWFGVRNYQARNFMRDAMQVGDHAQRFEALHQKLNQALSSIDGL